MNNFDLKSFLKENRLFTEQESLFNGIEKNILIKALSYLAEDIEDDDEFGEEDIDNLIEKITNL